MAKYRLGPKDILEKKLSRENPRLNYNRLYAAAVLAAFDAQESLEELNIGEARRILRAVCQTAEQLHLLPPDG